MTNRTSLYHCFIHDDQISECWWRTAFAQSPLLVFWFASPLVYLRLKCATNTFYIHPWRGFVPVGLLVILTAESIMNTFSAFHESLISGLLSLIMAISYASLAGAVELHRRRKQLIHASIYLSILLLTLFKLTFTLVKSIEGSIDSKLAVEVLLLMAETTFLSISDKPEDCKNESPEKNSSWLSKLLFSWMTPLISTGSKRTLAFDDLYPLRSDCCSSSLLPRWQTQWDRAQLEQRELNKLHDTNEPTSVVKPYIRMQFPLIAHITFCRVLADMIHYTSPVLLKQLIDVVSDPAGPVSTGIGIACLMFICAETRSFLQNHQVYGMFRLTVYFQAILNSTILKKTLRLSPTARAGRTSGEILNLVAVDVEKLIGSIPYLQNVWSIPFQITLAMTMLWFTIGPAALAGIAIMVTFIPINYYSSFYIKKAQLKQMKIKDERTKMSTELLNGLKVVKLYAWEEVFENRINELRRREVEQLKWVSIASRVVDAANAAAPFLVALASFTTFSVLYSPNALTPAIAFVSLAIFNQIRQPMRMLGMLINNLAQSYVSNSRVIKYLAEQEIDRDIVGECTDGNAIVLQKASLNWGGPSQPPLLANINITVGQGQMVGVVGPVGSGKSSLLSAVLGEMHLCGGSVKMHGDVAYVPQQPWIFNKSIRENILFGSRYEPKFYKKVVHACELQQDFEMFSDRDLTEMGENGVNLSGGQKARIGLARAVYQNRSIYLFDDPLSALDAHVGRSVFDRVLGPRGILFDRTRVLVTHGLHYTRDVDQIIVMDDGAIVQQGSYEELSTVDGMFSSLLRTVETEDEEAGEKEVEKKRTISVCESEQSEATSCDPKAQTLMKKEKMELGRVRTGVYWLYFKSMALRNTLSFFLFFILHYTFQILRSLWLSDWSDQNVPSQSRNSSDISVDVRLYVYGGIGFLEVAMIGFSFAFLTLGSLRASLSLHNPLIRALVRAPITFFDMTPIGRIVNRLAKDLEVVDSLAINLRQLTQSVLHVCMIFFLVSYSMPIFILVAVPLLCVYVILMRFFVPTIRQLKRMESVNRSPILSTFGETIQGVSSIRAYGKTDSTCLQLESFVDRFTQCKYLTISLNRWLATRLELLGNTVVISSAVIGTISTKYYGLSPGLVGLSVSYALTITEVLAMAVRMLGEMETNIVAVERVKEYHRIEPEAEWRSEPGPEPSWPEKGTISIKDYKMRYREDLPLVLNGVTADITAGEKVAVVGRTGSGKSSLTMGLFRMIESAGGHMFIDGLRTDQMGLHQLRSRMAIIPQDPVLFSGTLRFNLDPFGLYSDDQIWATLDKCQLSSFATAKNSGLEFLIAEGGKNMSVGERQLVCLGRALLRGGRIVVLDEATAAVDSVTDALVQTVVRRHFPGATIIAIAHRLDTIADYDKILVMEDGEVVEFASPHDLLTDSTSRYSQMVEKAKQMCQ